MPLITDSIPNLINGVSQQPPTLRLPSQSEEQINCIPSVTEGLAKRPPTESVAKIIDGTVSDAYIYTINRDTTERYQVIITNGDLKVFDLLGVEKTVAFPNGKGYLNSVKPSEDFRSVTVADLTFVVNKNTITALNSALSPTQSPSALVSILQGAYGQKYELRSGTSVVKSTVTVSETAVSETRTSSIASALDSNWNDGAYAVNSRGNVVHIKRNDNAAFDLVTADSLGGNGMSILKDAVQKFSDLPSTAPEGFLVEVVGDGSSHFDNYFLKFVSSVAGSTATYGSATGYWEETIGSGIKYSFNGATMPHQLVREADGTFTFGVVSWGNRLVGDVISAPNPSFVGQSIADIFFFKNRIGFLSDQNVIMSEAGSYFNFFPTTVTTVLDASPIDISVGHTKVSILRHAIPFDESLLLFSDQSQFILAGTDVLTQRTVSVSQTTAFESSNFAEPIGIGQRVYFGVNKGNFSGLREYYINTQSRGKEATEVTSHVPQYIKGAISKLAAAGNEDMILVKTNEDLNRIYLYKYFWTADNQKLQSAWGKWDFHEDAKILNLEFIENICYFLIQHSDGLYLEKMAIETGRIDDHSNKYVDGGYITYLDRRITEADVTMVYDSIQNQTTITVPYVIEGSMKVVVRPITAGDNEAGRSLFVVSSSGSTIVVRNDITAKALFIGQTYEQRYTFGSQYIQEESTGGSGINASGRLQLRYFTLIYDKSNYFRVEVTPDLREVSTSAYTGRRLGLGNDVLGKLTLDSGRFKFPVMSRNDRVKIEIINDGYLPSNFVSAEYSADFNPIGRRV